MLCRHCCRGKVNRPRGLCWPCYYTPGIRERYPPRCRPGPLAGNAAPPPEEPTDAAPGSEAKVQVMIERLALGRSLFHPRDERYAPECPVVIEPHQVSQEREAA